MTSMQMPAVPKLRPARSSGLAVHGTKVNVSSTHPDDMDDASYATMVSGSDETVVSRLTTSYEATVCASCGDVSRDGRIMRCGNPECKAGIDCRGMGEDHGCANGPQIARMGVPKFLNAEKVEKLITGTQQGEPKAMPALIKLVEDAGYFRCPLCLQRSGEPRKYTYYHSGMPSNIPSSRQPTLLLHLVKRQAETNQWPTLKNVFEEIFAAEPHRLLAMTIPMGECKAKGGRIHTQRTLPFLKQYPNARIMIVIEGLSIYGSGFVVCEGDEGNWRGGPISYILYIYLGKLIYQELLLSHEVGLFLMVCGPTVLEMDSANDIDHLVKSNRLNYVVGLTSDTVVPTAVALPMMTIIQGIVADFMKPRHAVETCGVNSKIFSNGGVAVWDREVDNGRLWMCYAHTKTRALGTMPPLSCDFHGCSNKEFISQFKRSTSQSEPYEYKVRYFCTLCNCYTEWKSFFVPYTMVQGTLDINMWWHITPGPFQFRHARINVPYTDPPKPKKRRAEEPAE